MAHGDRSVLRRQLVALLILVEGGTPATIRYGPTAVPPVGRAPAARRVGDPTVRRDRCISIWRRVLGWLGVVLSSVFAREFPAVVRARGAAYFQRRAVKIDVASNSEVHATVKGSEAYAVLLSARRTSLGVFCTCPYFDGEGRCKHVWATLLAAEARGNLTLPSTLTRVEDLSDDLQSGSTADDELGDDDSDGADAGPLTRAGWSPPPAVRSLRVPPRRPDWRTLVEKAGAGAHPEPDPAPTRAPVEIRYVVDVAASRALGNLVLRISTFDRQRDGTWTPSKPGHLRQSSLGELADDRDRQVLLLLAGAGALKTASSYSYSPYPANTYADPVVPGVVTIPSSLHAFVLRTLADSGRCSIRSGESGDGETSLRWEDEGYALALKVDRDPPAKVTAVAGRLIRGQEAIPLDAAPLLLESGVAVLADHAAPFDHGGAFGWVLLFRQHGTLAVPRRHEDELLEKLFSLTRLPRLDLPASLRLEELRLTPTPALRITLEEVAPWQGKRLMGALSFLYDGVVISATRPGDRVLRAAERRLLLRDGAAERAAAARLIALGFRAPRALRGGGVDDGSAFEISPARCPPRSASWWRQAGASRRRARSIARPDRSSWPSPRASIGSASMAPATSKACPRPSRPCSPQPEGAKRPSCWATASLGLLPEAWLERYGLLAGVGKPRGDQLGFRRSQVGMLDALLASQPEVEVDAAFARARDRLGSFTGVRAKEAPPPVPRQATDYQREGLGWLDFLQRFGFGGCLADDMGLGKTVQVLALLVGARRARPRRRRWSSCRGRSCSTGSTRRHGSLPSFGARPHREGTDTRPGPASTTTI